MIFGFCFAVMVFVDEFVLVGVDEFVLVFVYSFVDAGFDDLLDDWLGLVRWETWD